MTSSWLPVAEAASLRLPPDVLSLHVVELAATYLVQSTLFLCVGWALLFVLASLARRRTTKPDGQRCTSSGVSPAWIEIIWKLSAVLASVTAPLSVFTGSEETSEMGGDEQFTQTMDAPYVRLLPSGMDKRL